MAITLQARRLKDALQKAKQVGFVEDPVTIAGCSLVLRNLVPEDYVAISEEIEEVTEVRLPFAYQVSHVSRAIVDLNGEDLRDVAYIEDEVPAGSYVVTAVAKTEAAAQKIAAKLKEDLKVQATIAPPDDGQMRTVKVERHTWIAKNVLSTWSKESLSVAWRKLTELLVKADANAKEGIQFQTPDETSEERLRRLLHDIQEAWEDLPPELADRILSDSGLLRKSSLEELEAVEERMSSLAKQAPAQAEEDEEAPPPPPRPTPRRQAAAPQRQPPQVEEEDEPIQTHMAHRQPLNQQYTDIPQPRPREESAPTRPRVPVPDQIRQAALNNTVGVNNSMVEETARARPSRSQEIAAMEAEALSYEPPPMARPTRQPLPEDQPAELRKELPVDSNALRTIVERPPTVGINPKFRPRT